uniref:S-N-methylcoclaurine 3'-hydroxylase isozyme n=1 Tax=Rhizophora mucronata TaxID=61149 RepID=A0A2P2JZC0_RHIMU
MSFFNPLAPPAPSSKPVSSLESKRLPRVLKTAANTASPMSTTCPSLVPKNWTISVTFFSLRLTCESNALAENSSFLHMARKDFQCWLLQREAQMIDRRSRTWVSCGRAFGTFLPASKRSWVLRISVAAFGDDPTTRS